VSYSDWVREHGEDSHTIEAMVEDAYSQYALSKRTTAPESNVGSHTGDLMSEIPSAASEGSSKSPRLPHWHSVHLEQKMPECSTPSGPLLRNNTVHTTYVLPTDTCSESGYKEKWPPLKIMDMSVCLGPSSYKDEEDLLVHPTQSNVRLVEMSRDSAPEDHSNIVIYGIPDTQFSLASQSGRGFSSAGHTPSPFDEGHFQNPRQVCNSIAHNVLLLSKNEGGWQKHSTFARPSTTTATAASACDVPAEARTSTSSVN
jgi:hypothetical protein